MWYIASDELDNLFDIEDDEDDEDDFSIFDEEKKTNIEKPKIESTLDVKEELIVEETNKEEPINKNANIFKESKEKFTTSPEEKPKFIQINEEPKVLNEEGANNVPLAYSEEQDEKSFHKTINAKSFSGDNKVYKNHETTYSSNMTGSISDLDTMPSNIKGMGSNLKLDKLDKLDFKGKVASESDFGHKVDSSKESNNQISSNSNFNKIPQENVPAGDMPTKIQQKYDEEIKSKPVESLSNLFKNKNNIKSEEKFHSGQENITNNYSNDSDVKKNLFIKKDQMQEQNKVHKPNYSDSKQQEKNKLESENTFLQKNVTKTEEIQYTDDKKMLITGNMSSIEDIKHKKFGKQKPLKKLKNNKN